MRLLAVAIAVVGSAPTLVSGTYSGKVLPLQGGATAVTLTIQRSSHYQDRASGTFSLRGPRGLICSTRFEAHRVGGTDLWQLVVPVRKGACAVNGTPGIGATVEPVDARHIEVALGLAEGTLTITRRAAA